MKYSSLSVERLAVEITRSIPPCLKYQNAMNGALKLSEQFDVSFVI